MKKFFTAIPLQIRGQLAAYCYEAVDNQKLRMEEAVSFPILTAVNGYVEPGEDFRVICLMPDTRDGHRNFSVLEEQLAELCARRGLTPVKPEPVLLDPGEGVSSHVAAFQRLIDRVEEEDELFACITFGTKPLSQAILLAIQYAYRVKKNTSISCILYGQVDRSDPKNHIAHVYDETALIQLDEIVRVLADRGVSNPKAVIDRILAL